MKTKDKNISLISKNNKNSTFSPAINSIIGDLSYNLTIRLISINLLVFVSFLRIISSNIASVKTIKKLTN